MLLVTERHTKADLDAWRALARRDAVAAAWPDLAALTEDATRVILTAAEETPDMIVGCSWGKDSLVLAHLVWATGLPLRVVRMIQDRPDRRENPDTDPTRDAFLARFPLPHYDEFSTAAVDGLAEMNRHFQAPRYCSGVAARESKVRALTVARNGLISAGSVRPLGRWQASHVWAYLAAHHIPIHPAYGYTAGGTLSRDHIRVHSIGGPDGSGVGRHVWERRYYAEVWAELDRLKNHPPAVASCDSGC